jgi:hypothetical protein
VRPRATIIGIQVHHSVLLHDAMRGAINACAGVNSARVGRPEDPNEECTKNALSSSGPEYGLTIHIGRVNTTLASGPVAAAPISLRTEVHRRARIGVPLNGSAAARESHERLK